MLRIRWMLFTGKAHYIIVVPIRACLQTSSLVLTQSVQQQRLLPFLTTSCAFHFAAHAHAQQISCLGGFCCSALPIVAGVPTTSEGVELALRTHRWPGVGQTRACYSGGHHWANTPHGTGCLTAGQCAKAPAGGDLPSAQTGR